MRVIDNSRLRVRHIRRATAADAGAVQILGQWWAPAGSGIEGRQGWQSANVERRLSDHGVLQSLALPNSAGDDGQLHRDRFAVRSDPAYRLGTEWIEFRDADSGRPLFVGTPDSARVDGTTVGLTGVDAAGLLAGFREGKVAPWTPHGPLDVIDWYSRAPQQVVSSDFRGSSGLGTWTKFEGGSATVTPAADGMQMRAKGAGSPIAQLLHAIPATEQGGAWRVEVTGIIGTANVAGGVAIELGAARFIMAYSNLGSGTDARLRAWTPTPGAPSGLAIVDAASPSFTAGDTIQLEVVAIDGWLLFLRDGALVAQLRRSAAGRAPITQVRIDASLADFTVVSASVNASRPFLRRGAPAPDYRVAGAPTAGGLRGEYFLTYDEWVRSAGNYAMYGALIPAPLAEPYQRRLDPTVDFAGSPPTWQPPGPPNGEGFTVRWSGAIHLDPNVTDTLRLDGVDDMARVWVGKTMAASPLIDLWGLPAAGQGTATLASRLGVGWQAGWYPIVIEYAQGPNGGAGIRLQRWNGTSFITVPTAELSPYGCWDGDLANESHREAIDGVCASMGIGWRVQPMTLESGEFPGRLEPGARLGVDTDYQLTEDEATEYASEMAAGETVDRILGDAAGLGDNLGREGLTAEVLDPTVTTQPWVTTRYESLGDITEDTLLRQRLSSLLALYGSPMETVAARPRGQDTLVREFADSFPLVGDARLFLWEPDDGIRLILPTIGVQDRTPRRITSVAWPLTPDGRGAPAVGFRQRPKHLRATLQRLMRQAAVSRRHYQGQLAQITGSLGSSYPIVAPDGASRLPVAGAQLSSLVLRVTEMTPGKSGVPVVDGVNTGLTITAAGEYDVTAWHTPGRAIADCYLASMPAGTAYIMQLVATVRV